MKTADMMAALEAMSAAVLANESEIESLDREIGDGDHLINVKRGYAALLAMRAELAALPPAALLKVSGTKLMSTIGGASGPLFASFLLRWSKALEQPESDGSVESLARGFSAGVDAIKERGRADLGEKTMLDVLIPVARLWTRLAGERAPLPDMCAQIKEEAVRGMLATKDLVATKGRAHSLGTRAIGHIDPGAKTSQLAICAVCDLIVQGGTSHRTQGSQP